MSRGAFAGVSVFDGRWCMEAPKAGLALPRCDQRAVATKDVTSARLATALWLTVSTGNIRANPMMEYTKVDLGVWFMECFLVLNA